MSANHDAPKTLGELVSYLYERYYSQLGDHDLACLAVSGHLNTLLLQELADPPVLEAVA